MAKVISLKLKKKEERIINRLNQEGITNSELIREALWHYFKSPDEKLNNSGSSDELFNSADENDKEFLYKTLNHLNKEIDFLRKQNIKLKEDFSEELNRLRQQLYEKSPLFHLKNEEINSKEQYVFDIHKNIDEIINKKEHKI